MLPEVFKAKVASWAAVAVNPWSMAGLLLLWVASTPTWQVVFEGKAVTPALQAANDAAASFLALPLVRLALIPLAILLISNGAKKVERAKTAVLQKLENERATRDAIALQAHERASVFPRLCAQRDLLQREITGFDAELARLEKFASTFFEQFNAGWKNGERSWTQEISAGWPTSLDWARTSFRYKMFAVSVGLPDFEAPEPALEKEETGMGMRGPIIRCTYKPEANTTFLAIHDGNRRRIERWLTELREIFGQQEAALSALDTRIDDEARNVG